MIEQVLAELTAAIRAQTAAIYETLGQPYSRIKSTATEPAPPATIPTPTEPTPEPVSEVVVAAPEKPRGRGRPRGRTSMSDVALEAEEAAAAEPGPESEADAPAEVPAEAAAAPIPAPAKPKSKLAVLKPTADDCRAVLMRVARGIGRQASADLVKSMGVTQLGQMSSDYYEELIIRGLEMLDRAGVPHEDPAEAAGA